MSKQMFDNEHQGLVVVLSGPAGSGKDTVLNEFFKLNDAAKTISATTRAPRDGEADGVDYYFYSKQQFEEAIQNDLLLEYTTYCGNYYGTLKSEVERITAMGLDVILKIEVEGAQAIKAVIPKALLVFIIPPSAHVLASRLKGRGTEDKQTLRIRLERAATEISCGKQYDYILVNDQIEQAAKELASIISAEKLRVFRNTEFLDEVTKDVKAIIGN